MSSWLDVLSGVPQGSVLGPVLILVFKNSFDVQGEFATILKKFAEDTKSGQIVRGDADRKILQESLNNMLEWKRK